MTTSREIHLAARPQGWPTPADFRTVDTELAEPGPGEVLVRNTYLSVDPYMRGRMNDVKSYVPPFALDAVMDGGAVGEVVASGSDRLQVGDTVLHQAGWRTYALLSDRAARKVDVTQAPASAYLGALGMPGLTAYVGLTRIAEVREGDTVFISGAAGAVGSVAGQIAKQLGAAKVIGSAGTADKCAWLTELGFDVALNYKDAPIGRQLREHGPVDVYFDNVGGDHLEAALDAFNDGGRAALCGAIVGYNTTERAPGPDNLANIITRGLTVKGFTIAAYLGLAPEFREHMIPWFSEGKIAYDETVVDGIDNAVDAFLDMMRGANTGKMVVRTAPAL